MEISLGYLKDLLAFLSAILFFTLYAVCNMKLYKSMILIIFLLVLIFDGIFTFFPHLHNFMIKI